MHSLSRTAQRLSGHGSGSAICAGRYTFKYLVIISADNMYPLAVDTSKVCFVTWGKGKAA